VRRHHHALPQIYGKIAVSHANGTVRLVWINLPFIGIASVSALEFGTLLTAVGQMKVAAGLLPGGQPLDITRIALGDGNGAAVVLSPTRTHLVNEVHSQPVSSVLPDPMDNTVVIAESVIAPDVGGFWIREMGLYDADNDLIAYASFPATEKPVLSDGAGRELIIRSYLLVSSAAAVTIKQATRRPHWEEITHIPASVHIPGQIILFAGPEPAPGTLACDGAQVLRQQYPALFAAIGTRYGEGDGQTTFHLPNIAEGFALLNTHQPEKVGSPSSGENKAHTHAATVSTDGRHAHTASSDAAGQHAHNATIHAAGNHAHSASSAAAGSHAHSAWTDAQGQHTHPYTDYPGWLAKRGGSRSVAHWETRFGSHTGAAGHHAHNVGIGANGQHTHPISIAENGTHTHEATIDETGSHTHLIAVDENGDHSHSVTNAETGGVHNLAAGLFIRCCIAY